jgi:sulfotransferase
MKKTYHFMAGLPRSGSTVLSALLNQHPDVYASPQTDLLGMIYEINKEIPNYQSYNAGLFHSGYKNVLSSLADNFYSDINKPIVIDKNRGWGTPYNLDNLSPYVSDSGKIILTLRPILDILASYSKAIRKTENFLNYTPYLDKNLWVTDYRSKEDAQIEYLMQPNGEIDRAIYSVANLLKNHKERVLVIWFDDLLSNPQKTMNLIYDFLQTSRHKNNFNSIQEVEKHDDVNGYGIVGLHDVAQKLAKPKTNPEDCLSDYIINKYKNALDFLFFN